MKRLACSFVLLCGACLVVGCGKEASKGPPMAKVKGTVTLDRKEMGGGEVRFYAADQPVKSLAIKDGAFSGEVHSGKNRVEIVWEKDGPPNRMIPDSPPTKVNVVAPEFSGNNTPFNINVPEAGDSNLKFAVTSARY